MTEADGAAIDIQPGWIDSAKGRRQPEDVPAIGLIRPGFEAGEDLGGKCFVQFPEVDIPACQVMPGQQRRRGKRRL